MRGARASRFAIATAAILLLAALVPLAGAYMRWQAWRLPPEERAYVERTLEGGAAEFGTTREEYRPITRPVVNRLADRICITLASSRGDGGGSYRACYDRRSGQLLEEEARSLPLGPVRVSDRLRALIW